MQEPFDVVALGGGPGGYVAAIHAAQFGLRAAVVERDQLGGICLNLGCVPSKAMLRAVELLRVGAASADFGMSPDLSLDYESLVRHREAVIEKMRQGVINLLRANGVTVISGSARLTGAHSLEVQDSVGQREVAFRHLVIATGSHSVAPPIPGVDLPGVIDSDAALRLEAAPARALIIGGGAVGVEWAEIWRGLGAEVTVLELMPQLLPQIEPEIARELARAFNRKGIQTRVDAHALEIEPRSNGLAVRAQTGGAEAAFLVDTVLVATGRNANIEGLGLEAAGIHTEAGGIPTDDHMRTNVPHIYAVGDVTGRSLLAHVASHQGIIAADNIAGRERTFEERAVPAVVFTDPEIATVGLTEREAEAPGLSLKIGRFPFAALSRAGASGEGTGFVKLVARADTGEILGAHVIGPRAGDLVGEAALAIHLRATLQDLAETIHPHPTFCEALMEAAWAALGRPVHIPPHRERPARKPR